MPLWAPRSLAGGTVTQNVAFAISPVHSITFSGLSTVKSSRRNLTSSVSPNPTRIGPRDFWTIGTCASCFARSMASLRWCAMNVHTSKTKDFPGSTEAGEVTAKKRLSFALRAGTTAPIGSSAFTDGAHFWILVARRSVWVSSAAREIASR